MPLTGLGAGRDRGVNPGVTGAPGTRQDRENPAWARRGTEQVPSLLTGPGPGFPVPA